VNLPTNTMVASIFYSAGGLSGLALTPNGSYLYVAAESKNCVVVMNTALRTVVTCIPVGTKPVAVAITPNGAAAYVANSESNNVSVINTATNSVTATIPVGTKPVGVAITPDGTMALISNITSSNISVIGTASNSVVATWTALSGTSAAVVSPNGSVAYVTNQYANAVTVHSMASGAILATIDGFTAPNAIAVTPNGSYLYVTNANSSSVSVVDTASDQIVANPLVGLLPMALAISSDGSTVYVANADGYSLSVIGTATNTVGITIARVGIYPVGIVLSAEPPTGITKSAGDGQSAMVGDAFPTPLQVTVTDGTGNPLPNTAVTFSAVSGTTGASGTFSATPPMPVLTNQSGIATAPVLTANAIGGTFTVTASVNTLNVTFTLTNGTPSYALGSSTSTVGSAAGTGNVLLAANGPWTAVSNSSWLHVTAGSANGSGNASIQFSYDANSNPGAQTGSLTIGGQPFTVSQAGAGYVPVAPMMVLADSGLNGPRGVAVDWQGNVYIADTGNNAIKEWSAVSQQVTTLACPGLNAPSAVAVDANGNLYIADTGNNAVKEWCPANQQTTALVSSGLNGPTGVALDSQANVYIADTGNNAIKQWNAGSRQVITLAAQGLSHPAGVAVDVQGNVYVASSSSNAIDEWNATSQQMLNLVSSGLNTPSGTAVDGQGNVYIANSAGNIVDMWSAVNQQTSALVSSGLSNPAGTAVDSQGNVYIADTNNGAIKKLMPAYLALSTAGLNESAAAGTDSFGALVLPAGTPLSPTSNVPWLTITGASGGSVGFAFQANTSSSSRTGLITVLGVPVTVTQSPDTPAGLTKIAGDGQATLAGQAFPATLQVQVTDSNGNPLQGVPVTFSVTSGSGGASGAFALSPSMPIATDQNGNAIAPVLTANSIGGIFTVTASASSMNVIFTLTNFVDALATSSTTVGAGAGTGGVILSAGGAWTAATNATWLHLAVSGGAGNTLIGFTYDANPNSTPRTGTLTLAGMTFTVMQVGATFTPVTSLSALIASGLKNPQGVAVDSQENVYIADTGHNAIKEWNPSTQQTATLISSGLNAPSAIAVDTQGNVYIADTKNNAIKEWNAATGMVVALVSSGLSGPSGVAVDGQGNVYFSDTSNNAIKEWVAASQQVVTLVSANLNGPRGVAVDLLGNVYFADTKNNAVKEWNAANQSVSELVSAGLNSPSGVAVDGEGNVYIIDTGNNALKQWSPASQQVTTLLSAALKSPTGLAIDGQGNLYIANSAANAIDQAVPAYIAFSPSSLNEAQAAGTDSVSVQVVPASAPWTAASNQTWLKITGSSGGVINVSFTANTAVNSRSATITVLGQQLTVNQSGDTPASIAKSAGTGETVVVGLPLATNLEVRIKDAAGMPVSGAPVTFTVTPGAKGATATFASSPPMPILTNSTGFATAPVLTAGSITGTFTVTATSGALSTVFTLKILAQ
jgi:YVTN family beta-propeller protein